MLKLIPMKLELAPSAELGGGFSEPPPVCFQLLLVPDGALPPSLLGAPPQYQWAGGRWWC